MVFVAVSVVLITVWFREPDGGLLHRGRSGFQTLTAPVSAAGEFVTRPVRGLVAWASDLGVTRSQLERLRDQNIRLRARVAELEEARLENVRLRALVHLPQVRAGASLAAHVIGMPVNAWEGVITIDRGTADGVKAGMPVVGAEGLLGQTVQVAKHSSRVRLISDQRSGVAALIQRNRAEGIVKGSIEGALSLDFVSRETTVRAGDVVITSGIGGVYPKGLVIGEVSEVDRRGDSLYQTISVKPASDLAGLEEVVVLVDQSATPIPQGGE